MTGAPFRVGELAYVNTLPFRLGDSWTRVTCPSPRRLAQWAEEGRIDAGVLPVVEAWRLEDQFEGVGSFGIAVKRKAGSVLLFSKRPWAELNGATIGVTDQSATSVQLLKVLLEKREAFNVRLVEGFRPADEARLLIGDEALTPSAELRAEFPHVTDLGEEWHAWHGGPFVFARWMIRRTAPRFLREELGSALDSALDQFDAHRPTLCRQAAKKRGVPASLLEDYFGGFVYRLGIREEQAETLFRDLVSGRAGRACC